MEQVVLITGCSSGIGHALAVEFARRGHRCFATARREEAVEALRKEGFEAVSLDVTDAGSIRDAVACVLERAGRIDVLVNNAGMSLFGPLAEIPLGDVRRMVDTNLLGPLAVVQAVFPTMAKQRSGRIVNVGSIVGVVPTPWVGAYAGAKAGLHVISEALRMEVSPWGIDVIVVQPGAVRSDVAEKAPVHARTPHYAPIADAIEQRSQASQTRGPMPAEDFARQVVDAVLRPKPPLTVRAGGGLGLLRALRLLPRSVREGRLAAALGVRELKPFVGTPTEPDA
ncbi:MAG: SDR family oxidoreductase [Myxococcota bacterium]|nr:SDR family oxidoreductase [Myxococcota bacterium]